MYPVIIAAGAALSAAVNFRYAWAEGILLPAGFEGASLSFQFGETPLGTFFDVYDEAGFEVMVVAGAGRFVGFDTCSAELRGIQFMKVRAGSAASPILQAADRTLLLVKGDYR